MQSWKWYWGQSKSLIQNERGHAGLLPIWPLWVAALKLFVFSQPYFQSWQGLTKLDKRLEGAASPLHWPGRNVRVSAPSVLISLSNLLRQRSSLAVAFFLLPVPDSLALILKKTAPTLSLHVCRLSWRYENTREVSYGAHQHQAYTGTGV